MKKALKIIFIIFGIIIGVMLLLPIVLVLLLLDPAKPPVAAYRTQEELGFSKEELLSSSFDAFFEDPENNPLCLEVDQDQLNVILLQEVLRKSNPNYLMDDAPENQLIVKDSGGYAIPGVWANIKKDRLTIKLRVNLADPVSIRTSVSLQFRIKFSVEENPEEMQLQLMQIKLGNLPIPKKMLTRIINMVGKRMGGAGEGGEEMSVETLIEQLFTSVGIPGTFNDKTWTATVNKIELIEKIMGDGEGPNPLLVLVKLLTKGDLLNLEIKNSKLRVEFKSNRFYLKDDDYPVVPDLLKFQSEEHKDLFLRSKATNFMLSAINSEEGELYINMTEMDINRLLDFYLGETELSHTFNLVGNTYKFEVLTPVMTIGPDPEGMNMKFKLLLYDETNPDQKFETIISIKIEPTSEEHDLRFEVGSLKLGPEIELTVEETEALLATFGANDMLGQNMLVINGFLTNFATYEIRAKDVQTYPDYLKLICEGTSPEIIETINQLHGAIMDALQTVGATNPDVQAIYDELQEAGELTEEVVAGVINDVSQLPPEDVMAIKAELMAALGGTVPGLGGIIPPA